MLADTIKEARGIVEKGWCQGRYKEGEQFCAIGAVFQASGAAWAFFGEGVPFPIGGHPERARDASALLNGIAKQMGHVDVPHFNDDPNTTQQDVLNFFDKALAELGAL